MKRPVDTVVISDVHLGTSACRAVELTQYLNSIEPKRIILNGDIIDFWHLKKGYLPEAHMYVIRTLITMMAKGVQVIYLTGNHDEVLRKVSPLKFGSLTIQDKLILEFNGEKVWFFHGDIFDITMKYTKWLPKFGSGGYSGLLFIKRVFNGLLNTLGFESRSLSKKIKNSMKSAVRYIDDFEKTIMKLAIEEGYDYVACGHIHQPKIRGYQNKKGSVIYMNSGDWVEHLTALEYDGNEWDLFCYKTDQKVTNNTVDLMKENSESLVAVN